jgi:hypothetical protein
VRVHVEVTREDIRRGKARNYEGCPIALALLRHGEGAFEKVYVSDGIVTLTIDGWMHEARLSSETTAFVNAIDHRLPVKPFSFELDVPVKALKERR